MCGLIGFSGKNNNNFNINKIKLLMYWNSVERGKDSTGIWSPKNKIIKSDDKAEVFIRKYKIKEDNEFIGHVRKSTVGAATKENAHPYEFGNIIGVHNGTIESDNIYIAEKDDPDNLSTDSQYIFYYLNKHMDGRIFMFLKGSFAVIFKDKNQDGIFVIRNNLRPLYHGDSEEGKYISSIKETLLAIDCKNVREFKERIMYKIVNGEIVEHKRIPDFSDYVQNNTRTSYVNNNYNYYFNDCTPGYYYGCHHDTRMYKNKFVYIDYLMDDDENKGINRFQWYYVEDAKDDNLEIINENGNKVSIRSVNIELGKFLTDSDLNNHEAVTNRELKVTDSDEVIPKGTVFNILSSEDDHIDCVSKDGKNLYSISKRNVFIRKMKEEDESNSKNNDQNDQSENNKDNNNNKNEEKEEMVVLSEKVLFELYDGLIDIRDEAITMDVSNKAEKLIELIEKNYDVEESYKQGNN